MAGYDLELRIVKGFHDEAKAFFDFLRQAARLHPVALSVRKVKDGEYYATLDGTPGAKVDAFLQELMMSRALYYYACGIKNRRRVAAKVIAPIFQQLLESRFAVCHHPQDLTPKAHPGHHVRRTRAERHAGAIRT
jgi:hypothetical protein